MIYGLYLSATGVLANSYRQDVIANNLANAETVGFKRDVALFQERLTAAQEQRVPAWQRGDPTHERLGGGLFITPTSLDLTQGDLEPTGNSLDAAIQGPGFFAVDAGQGQTMLTRSGQFLIDRSGYLVLANTGQRVLDVQGRPIPLDGRRTTAIDRHGLVAQDGRPVAQLGVFDVPDPQRLRKEGRTLFSYPDAAQMQPVPAVLRNEFLERANIDPAVELTRLMEAQRLMEANANMIRYQDQTLAKLVNEVGKIG